MMSDILFQAVVDIESYEREMPDIYGQWRYRWRIAITRAVMNWMREQPGMDTLPRRGVLRFIPRLPRNQFRKITGDDGEVPE